MSEELIEKIARTLYGIRPAIQQWNGDPYAFHEPGAHHERELAYKQARAVAAVLDDVPKQ
ncbi:hypothetical protein BKG82_26980 [Mycobacteroides chelonae]|uniref:Uncharacterized protein n=1 Tax=Mycobacteroides chelonae TaxID=1774 RepID=A0A1S1LD03_MYCCH|nr:hypothetical protein [Mycobacteroides chelonae]OHU47298.1 hypothetical protein BKG82_26980 [Mycobacteroides chelonae]